MGFASGTVARDIGAGGFTGTVNTEATEVTDGLMGKAKGSAKRSANKMTTTNSTTLEASRAGGIGGSSPRGSGLFL